MKNLKIIIISNKNNTSIMMTSMIMVNRINFLKSRLNNKGNFKRF